jgi:hypothetical protein
VCGIRCCACSAQMRPVEQALFVCDRLERQYSAGFMLARLGHGQLDCGASSSQSCLRHPPPGSFIIPAGVLGWAMWDGTAIRSQLQLPVAMVSGLCDRDRGSKGRSATVDCCSSDLSVPDGKQGTIFARGTSVSSTFRVYAARECDGGPWFTAGKSFGLTGFQAAARTGYGCN